MIKQEIVITDYGKTEWMIVIPRDAIASERHAAEELKNYLSEITGANLPILEDDCAYRSKSFILGTSNHHLEYTKHDLADYTMGKEGFLIQVNSDHVIIAGGRPRGTLYGVYTFLEEKLGCRWFYRGVETIPKRSRLLLAPVSEYQNPVFEYRDPYFRGSIDGDWHARNKSNSDFARLENIHGKKVKYSHFVHTFDHLIPVSKYFADHPEYYSEIDGKRISERPQLCLTNPEVLEISIDRVKNWLREDPDVSIVSVSQNDWINYCQCESCSELDDKEGSHSGSLIHFVNSIAEAIEPEFPDVAIDTLAYQYTRKPPSQVRPRHNVIVRLCSIECCFSHPLEACSARGSFKQRDWVSNSFSEDLIAWSKICNRLHIWDYVTNFANYIQPFPNFHVLQKNIQFFARHHVTGIFEEGNASYAESSEFDQLRQYVLAKLLWNPYYDMDIAINEFLSAYYGQSATQIKKYFDLMHQQVNQKEIHMGIYDAPDSVYLNSDFIEAALLIFDEAEKVADNPDVLKRVQVARLPVQYVKIQNLPNDYPGRKEMIDRFLSDIKSAGIKEIRENRPLEQSADLLYQGIIVRHNV